MIKFLKGLWTGETDGLAAAAFIVGAASLASRVVGVLRDRILASTFGAGVQLDAYYAAFRLPDFLYNLIILGALSAGFIPVFTQYLETKGKEGARQLAEMMVSLVLLIMSALAIVLTVVAPKLVPLTTPGFAGEKLALTIQLSRIMFLSPVLLGLSGVMGGILQSTRRFIPFAFAPILYNLGIIAGARLLVPWFGIKGLAWGVVVGAFLHLIAQASVAGIRRLPWPSLRSEGVRRILKLMVPRTLGLAATQINLVILLILASSLPTGSVAVFNLADNLQNFPVGLIGISFAIAAFPALSRAFALKDQPSFQKAFSIACRNIIFFLLPVTVLFLLFRAQIVRLILGSGQFDWDDTIRTANVLGWFTLSLLAQSLIPLFARAFYALHDTWTPLAIGIVDEILTGIGAYFLRGFFGVNGLAMAFSIASTVQLVLLYVWLRFKHQPLGGRVIFTSIIKTSLATMALSLVALELRQWIGTVYPLRKFWQLALQVGVGSFAGLIVFVIVAWLLRSQELQELFSAVARRLWRKQKVAEGMDEAQGV